MDFVNEARMAKSILDVAGENDDPNDRFYHAARFFRMFFNSPILMKKQSYVNMARRKIDEMASAQEYHDEMVEIALELGVAVKNDIIVKKL